MGEVSCTPSIFTFAHLGSIGSLEEPVELRSITGYAFVTDARGFHSFDIREPSNPQQAGFLPGEGFGPFGISGLYAAVGRSYNGWNGVLILDVSEPRDPVEVGRVEVPGARILYIVDRSNFTVRAADGKLWRVDITDPEAPSLQALYAPPGGILPGSISGDLAEAARRQFIEGRIPSYARFPLGAYLASLDGGLQLFDLRSGEYEQVRRWRELDLASGVAVTIRQVYVFNITEDQNPEQRELIEVQTRRISTGANAQIVRLGDIPLPGEIQGELVCQFIDSFYDLLTQIDTDPISHAGSRPAEIGGFLRGVEARGDQLIVASEREGLQLFEVLPIEKSLTYRSDEGRFAFDYPNGLIIYEQQQASGDGTVVEDPERTFLLANPDAEDMFWMFVGYFPISNGETFEEIMARKLATCADPGSGDQIEIGGHPAHFFRDTMCGMLGPTSFIYLERRNTVYEIRVQSRFLFEGMEPQVRPLLESFRTLE